MFRTWSRPAALIIVALACICGLWLSSDVSLVSNSSRASPRLGAARRPAAPPVGTEAEALDAVEVPAAEAAEEPREPAEAAEEPPEPAEAAEEPPGPAAGEEAPAPAGPAEAAPGPASGPGAAGVSFGEVDDLYLTAWLHHAHGWFKGGDKETARRFVVEARETGFTSIMTNFPWSWTEREARGAVSIDSHNKDWIEAVCEEGLGLHVVLAAFDTPSWFQDIAAGDASFFERASDHKSCANGAEVIRSPSLAHPEAWAMVAAYIREATRLLVAKYGDCVRSVSPTVNNELETRYIQTYNAMRDYSEHMQHEYREWQLARGLPPEDPFAYPCDSVCEPIKAQGFRRWQHFREDFLARRYEESCRAVHEAWREAAPGAQSACLLHFGEFFATTDVLNGNPFFRLARSKYVDHVVMDSNMALLGAPSSPSIVGALVATAKGYGKVVHYEAATERVLPCSDEGELLQPENGGSANASALLVRTGVENALAFGVDSLGITNLCSPATAKKLLPFGGGGGTALRRALPRRPEAVLFVPYGVFYVWSFLVSGVSCGAVERECWHPSFDAIPTFGWGRQTTAPGMCAVDLAQDALLRVWDGLVERTPSDRIRIVGDASMLREEAVAAAAERVLVRFDCAMDGDAWDFPGGAEQKEAYEAAAELHPFEERVVPCEGFRKQAPKASLLRSVRRAFYGN